MARSKRKKPPRTEITSTPRPHEQIVQDALNHAPHLLERYDTEDDFRAAWDDPAFDYDAAGVDLPDPYLVGRHDDILDIMLESSGVEAVMAWRRIHADVKKGVALSTAVQRWGVRGHPDFEEWFPVTPPPWGDARLARTILDRQQAEQAAREALQRERRA